MSEEAPKEDRSQLHIEKARTALKSIEDSTKPGTDTYRAVRDWAALRNVRSERSLIFTGKIDNVDNPSISDISKLQAKDINIAILEAQDEAKRTENFRYDQVYGVLRAIEEAPDTLEALAHDLDDLAEPVYQDYHSFEPESS